MGHYNWEEVILKCFKLEGNEADEQRVYKRIPDFIQLTEEHLKETYDQTNYHHQVRTHIAKLKKSGDLVEKGRGRYALTQQGLARTQESPGVRKRLRAEARQRRKAQGAENVDLPEDMGLPDKS